MQMYATAAIQAIRLVKVILRCVYSEFGPIFLSGVGGLASSSVN